MHPTEKIVRQFHESWDMRDPERGVAVIAEDCQFEDVARSESQIGPDGYRSDYERWRRAFSDGEVKEWSATGLLFKLRIDQIKMYGVLGRIKPRQQGGRCEVTKQGTGITALIVRDPADAARGHQQDKLVLL